jgi:hypothetical protein
MMPTKYHGHNSRGSLKHPIFQKALKYGHVEVLDSEKKVKENSSLAIATSVALGLALLLAMV